MASIYRDEISRLELLHAAHPDGLVFPHLADAYRRAGRYTQAESVLSAGLRRHSDYSSAHIVLGRLRLDQGQHEEAERAFRRVLELDPQNESALESLGRVALERGRLQEALVHFRRLARMKPSDELRAQVTELEQRLGELQGPRNGSPFSPVAGEPYDERVPSSRSPEPGEVVTETMAELYARQGLHERAASVYRQLLQRDPSDERLRAKLRSAQAQTGGDQATAAEPASPRQPLTPAPPHASPPPSTERRAPAWRVPASTPAPRSTATVREHLRGLLGWSSPPGAAGAVPAAEPVADAVPWRAPPGRTGVVGAGVTRVAGKAAMDGVDGTSRSLIAITDMLVGLLEYRDPFFRGSSSLTRLVAENVAVEMGLPASQRVDLALAAVLRDLGRLAMGGRLVTPTTSQAPEGRRKIERHVDLALHLLEGTEVPQAVRLAVRHHHERWDGGGYPDGLAGTKIPLLARVLAVVDSFAAMVSPRSYRVPRKVPDAARELREASGTQYDPAVVKALLKVVGREDQPHLGFVKRPHILLVNPDQPGAVVTAAKLCSAGYLAEVSADPSAARERLRRVPVAALVVSLEAGEESAASFVRDMRVDPLFSALPIVVVDAANVDLRVRLLESGADVCFPPGTTFAELQGTLGALVRRTLRADRDEAGKDDGGERQDSPWLALQGDISDFPLTWLLQVMKYDSRTAAIGIRSPRADGAIYLQKGDAVHAQIRGAEKGESALRRMLQWEEGRFTVQPEARPRERTINTSIMHLLLAQAVDEDHAAAGIFGAVSDRS